MAKYAISPQGVQSFRTLAESLNSSVENIKTANKSLQASMDSVMDSTGIYGLEIWNVTLKIGDALSDGEESVNTLVGAINKTIGDMEQLFSFGESVFSLAGSVTSNSSASSVSGCTAGSVTSNSSASSVSRCTAGSGGGLPHTNQTYNSKIIKGIEGIEGKTVSIFDHPEDVAKGGVINQGHNDLGIKGTCGLCSSGTVMNMGGGHYTETDVVKYAKENKLIGERGGTSPRVRAKIISDMCGIPVDNVRVKSIDDLVGYIENGQGVIIAVEASLYKPEWYGEYEPDNPKGHAVVLSSVIRDPNTKEILKYVVIDSNGDNVKRKACQYVDPKTLQLAFSTRGREANVTRNILF